MMYYSFPDALRFSLRNSTHASIINPAESGDYVEDALTRPGTRVAGLILALAVGVSGYLLLIARRPAVGATLVILIGWLLNVI